MKISELLENKNISEIAVGKVPSFFDPRRLWGQGKINRQTYNMIVSMSKNLFNQWSRYSVVLDKNIKIQAKTDIRLKNNMFVFAVKKNHFKYFLKTNLKLADNDPIFQKIDSLFGKVGEGYNNTNIKNIIDMSVTSTYLGSIVGSDANNTISPKNNQSMTAKMAQSSAVPNSPAPQSMTAKMAQSSI